MRIRSIFIKIMLPMVMIVCLSAVAILAITGRLFDNAYENQIINQVRESSSIISQSVEGFMSKAYAVTEGLAYSEDILTMDHDAQTPVVKGTAERNNYFELIYIQDMKGDQTARSSGELGNRANRWWFTLMLEKNRPFVSKSYYSVNTNMACASIFFPIVKNDRTIGILATDIKLATLQSLVEEFSDTKSGKIVYIIDGEGTVLAHPESIYYEELYNYKNLTKTVTKKDGSGNTLYDGAGNILTEELPLEVSREYEDMISRVMSGQSGTIEVTDNGTAYYAGYAPVKLDGFSDSWSVVTLQDKAKAMTLMNQVNQSGINIAAAAVILSIIMITFITRTITKPIKLSHERLKQLSEGDLTTVVPAVGGKDESAQLLENLNKTIAVLRDIIQKINYSVREMAEGDFRQRISSDFEGEFNDLTSSLNEIVGSVGRTLHQINICSREFMDGLSTFDGTAHSLAEGTTSQASAVAELSATLAGVSGKITQNAENSQNADRMMSSVNSQLQQSNEDLEKLISAMETIETNAEEINGITRLMQDIASQTNLLSMNAAVEAARAGESGKSFGVLASEIRTLAAQCSKAAVDTFDLIERTKKSVQTGMNSLKMTVSSIRSASDKNDTTSRLISEISAATSEQLGAMDQINVAIGQISEITHSNAATATETAQTSASMKRQAEQLRRLLDSYQYEV